MFCQHLIPPVPWLYACPRTMEPGEWEQIVGMCLNETNYYMLTAFTMADLKELGLFNLAPQDSILREVIPLTVCIFFFSPLPPLFSLPHRFKWNL